MNIQTLSAPTIHEALLDARRRFGDGVVLLESVPPQGEVPARVKVMIDEPLPQEAPAPPPGPDRMPEPAATPAGFGYPTLRETASREAPVTARGREKTAPAPASFSAAEAAVLTAEAPAPEGGEPPGPAHRETPVPPAPSPRPRGRLFPGQDGSGAPVQTAASTETELERLLRAQLQKLHERLDQIERRAGDTIIGASQRFAAHPLFARLLQQGLLPGTATRLFDALAAHGYGPETDEETLRWALARELRRMLDVAAPTHGTGTLALIGPSGAGKTALALKLAAHPGFYGRRRTTVLVVQPEDPEAIGYHAPLDLYRRFGLPVRCVQTPEEMGGALDRVRGFDQILIDTPPLPARPAAARTMLLRLTRFLSPIVPLQVQLVLNTTRALESFDAAYLQNLPLRPDALALTHLDETVGWGRVAEWMLQLRLPVQFASTGPRIPDGLTAFSPSWFVEELMQS